MHLKPAPTEYAQYYGRYIQHVTEDDALAALATEQDKTFALFKGLTDAGAAHRYAPGKWTVREVIGHLSDSERVFAYRAMRFGRGDETPLPGFDQDPYVTGGEWERRPIADVIGEWRDVRRASVALFRGLPQQAWARSGVASNNRVSVRALLYIVIGHERHHAAILRTQYGLPR